MNNKEKINAMTIEELAGKLCDLVQEVMYRAEKTDWRFSSDCKYCPANQYCEKGKTGFIDMLAQEAEENSNAQKV